MMETFKKKYQNDGVAIEQEKGSMSQSQLQYLTEHDVKMWTRAYCDDMNCCTTVI